MANEIEQGVDGLYALCVFDAEDATDTELQELFGKFGEVVNLHRTKNLVFIRYELLLEAVTCYESMQNQHRFRVRPGKRKTNSDNFDNPRNKDSFDGSFKNGDMNRNNNNGNFGGRKSDGSDFKPKGFGSGFSPNRSDVAVGSPPPLKPVIPETKTTESARVAKEVVIGNIPPKMLQFGIYNLCKKAGAEPLHVAMKQIIRPQRIPVHYAYVYVKEDKDVANIINGLHSLKLNGYQLIVKSAETLMEEGKVLSQ